MFKLKMGEIITGIIVSSSDIKQLISLSNYSASPRMHKMSFILTQKSVNMSKSHYEAADIEKKTFKYIDDNHIFNFSLL